MDDAYRSSIINIYARSLGGFPLAFFYGKQRTENLKQQWTLTYPDASLEQTRKSVRESIEFTRIVFFLNEYI